MQQPIISLFIKKALLKSCLAPDLYFTVLCCTVQYGTVGGSVHFNSKTIVKDQHQISEALALHCLNHLHYCTQQFVELLFKNKELWPALISHTCLELDRDCQKLVKKKKSVLRATSFQDLKSFKWLNLLNDLKKETQILFKVLTTLQ